MENRNMKIILGGCAALAVILLIGLLIALGAVKKTNNKLNEEQLRYEKLMAEKTQADADIAKLKSDLEALNTKLNENGKLLEETNNKLAAAERRARALAGESAALKACRTETEDLKKAKADLESEAASLRSEYDKLMAKSNELQKNNELLEQEKKQLAAKLDELMLFDTDNIMVTAVRGKKTDKPVICAVRTKRINMSFDVPKTLTDDISFRIKTPSGQTVTAESGEIKWNVSFNTANLTASLSPFTGEFEESRQVNLTYTPKEKLTTGVYSIELICRNKTIGNCRIRLR
ncbi:MAG TPA: hypothetical protein P5257_05305 [Bacteroidales bacterium]|nr:hypothetical protein [Bacteroidales bacterium]HRR94031.1 hypothetical protein [Bacteroidales bacterium]HRT89520.1 hypothetical protein [Bacteroidales bacterium]